RQIKISGHPLHPDAVIIRLSFTSPVGAAYWVRDLMLGQGGNAEFRLPASSGSGAGGGLSGTITLANSDKICGLGDSYHESSFALRDKHPGARVGGLSDWRYETFGWAGYDNIELNNVLLSNLPRYGTTFSEINPSHTFIMTRANDAF